VVVLVLAAPGDADVVARLAPAKGPVEAAGGLLVVVDPEDAPDVAAVYGRFRAPGDRGGPVAFLVDRWGYLRARWRPGEPAGRDDERRLATLVARLAAEPAKAPPADPHVH
jgi:hypothetical protein